MMGKREDLSKRQTLSQPERILAINTLIRFASSLFPDVSLPDELSLLTQNSTEAQVKQKIAAIKEHLPDEIILAKQAELETELRSLSLPEVPSGRKEQRNWQGYTKFFVPFVILGVLLALSPAVFSMSIPAAVSFVVSGAAVGFVAGLGAIITFTAAPSALIQAARERTFNAGEKIYSSKQVSLPIEINCLEKYCTAAGITPPESVEAARSDELAAALPDSSVTPATSPTDAELPDATLSANNAPH